MRVYSRSPFAHATDFCEAADVSYHWWRSHVEQEHEPLWLRNLRAIKRLTGCTWDDLFDGR